MKKIIHLFLCLVISSSVANAGVVTALNENIDSNILNMIFVTFDGKGPTSKPLQPPHAIPPLTIKVPENTKKIEVIVPVQNVKGCVFTGNANASQITVTVEYNKKSKLYTCTWK